MTVDDTAPEVTGLSKDLYTGNLTVTARDNQHIAVVQVLNDAGTKVMASAGMAETAAGEAGRVTIDLFPGAARANLYGAGSRLCRQ